MQWRSCATIVRTRRDEKDRHPETLKNFLLLLVKMDSRNNDSVVWLADLEYYEGWLDTEGETKTRCGGLQHNQFYDWLDLKVNDFESLSHS